MRVDPRTSLVLMLVLFAGCVSQLQPRQTSPAVAEKAQEEQPKKTLYQRSAIALEDNSCPARAHIKVLVAGDIGDGTLA
jgi:hypothetical protein